MTNMRVEEFAIGFGPKLFSYKKGETLYSLRIIPLGGFNKISGMDPDEKNDPKAYSAKPIWARMIVILAGSLMNFILPVILFFMVFMSSGIETPSDKPILGTILPDKPAAIAGLHEGDRIIAVNNKQIINWQEFVEIIQVSPNTSLTLDVQKTTTGQLEKVTITPQHDESANKGVIGVVQHFDKRYPGVIESAALSVKATYTIMGQMLIALKDIFTGQAPADVAGPIGVMRITGEVAQQGIMPLLKFAGFLSLNLGLINLFPIPALDGGHFIFLMIEAIRRKPISKRVLETIHTMGFVLLISLMILVTFKDIMR